MSRLKQMAGLVVMAGILATGGCVRSLNPIVAPADRVFDPALVGTWRSEDGKQTWVFAKSGDNGYALVYTDAEGRPAQFKASLARLGDDLFLDFFPDEPAQHPNGFYQWHVLTTHSFVHLGQLGSSLRMRFPDADWLKGVLRDDPGALQHAFVDDELILTAPTPALQAFWRKHAATDGAFESPVRLRRQPAAAE